MINPVCIFTTTQEFEAVRVQEKLIEANVDAMLLKKGDAISQLMIQMEIYVPLLQVEKAKTILKVLND